jgi:hypothetical protein
MIFKPVTRFPRVIVRVFPTSTFPVRATPELLFRVKFSKFVTLEGMLIPADDPPNTSEEDEVAIRLEGVPATAGPFNVRVFEPIFNVPAVNVRTPPTVILPLCVTPMTLFIVRLFRIITLDGIVIPPDDPPNTSDEEAETERLFGVPAIAGPFNVNVLAPTLKEPVVSVNIPVTATEEERVAPDILFTVRLLTVAGRPVPVIWAAMPLYT